MKILIINVEWRYRRIKITLNGEIDLSNISKMS